jgi:hypothetical protein
MKNKVWFLVNYTENKPTPTMHKDGEKKVQLQIIEVIFASLSERKFTRGTPESRPQNSWGSAGLGLNSTGQSHRCRISHNK